MKMKEAPPSPIQTLQPSVSIPSFGDGGVLKEGTVQSMAPPPYVPPTPCTPPPLSDCGSTQLFERGSKNFTFLSDNSHSTSRIIAVVDSLTTKKKRKGSDSSLLVGGRYDLRSRALR